MSMPLRAAQAIVKRCIERLRTVVPGGIEAQIGASQNNLAAVGEVQKSLEQLIAGGYRLDRLRSTLILCNEIERMQQQIIGLQGNQKARLLQLQAGLNEVQ